MVHTLPEGQLEVELFRGLCWGLPYLIIFITDLEGEMEYSHIKDDSELSRAVNKLQERAAIHRGLHRLENGLTGTDTKLNKTSCT